MLKKKKRDKNAHHILLFNTHCVSYTFHAIILHRSENTFDILSDHTQIKSRIAKSLDTVAFNQINMQSKYYVHVESLFLQ